MERQITQFFTPARIAFIALFSAVAGVLYAFGFAISGAFPSWLELNFSDIPALIGTFALGPASGAAIIVVKILIKLIIKGTSTIFVGELADLIIGLAFVLPAGLIYKRKRTFKGALIGMAAGSACSTAMAIFANWLILVPFYVEMFFGGNWDYLVGIMQALFGEKCTKDTFYNYYLWISVLPFNLMRCLIAVAVTLPVYKRISVLIKRLNEKFMGKVSERAESGSSECAGGATAECSDGAVSAQNSGQRKRVLVYSLICGMVLVLLVGGVLLRYFLG